MKTNVLFLILTFIYTVGLCQQRKYVDLNVITDAPDKSDWANSGNPIFQDEFTTMSYYNYYSSSGCGAWDSSAKLIVIRSDNDWRWGWDFYGKHADPTYEQLDDVIISDTGYISLQMAYHPTGVEIDPSNNNDLRYPVKKYYSA